MFIVFGFRVFRVQDHFPGCGVSGVQAFGV